MTPVDRQRWSRWAAAAALVLFTWGLAVVTTGGFHLALGPLGVSSRTATRPFVAAALAALAAVWLTGTDGRAANAARILRWGAALRAAITAIGRWLPSARLTAAALSVTVGIVGWTYGSQTASGPDSFAYVSQAALWRSGRLDVPIPLAANAPWPSAPGTFAPFGYRASEGGDVVVPITAPGVPMIMAALQSVAGHRAAFFVTPAAGALAVWLTFLIGCRVRSPVVGLASAWLVATSPAFLYMLMWPMTDITAAMCAALVVWLALGRGTSAALLAGLAAGLGMSTRPNFVLVAAAVGGWLLLELAAASERRRALARVGAFIAGVAPAVLVTIALNLHWYGHPLASGYGTAGDLLALDRVTTNAGRYASWLVETSPLFVVGASALLIPLVAIWGRPAWRLPALFVAVSLATVSVYLVYQPFNDWWYLRFLLPMWPILAVSTAAAAHALARGSRIAGVTLAAIVLAAGVSGVRDVNARGYFALGEERYVSVAALVASATEPTATVLTMSHSGTVRYYAGRETIRYDLLDPAWLDRTIEWLAARGRKPYILVEDWELVEFRARFGPTSPLGRLEFIPAATWESTTVAGRVFLYDPIERDRFATADPGAALERGQPRSADSRFPKLAFE